MDNFSHRTVSFSKVFELIGKPVKHDEASSSQLEQDLDPKASLLPVTVHQELLESASDFFLNALKSDKWKEAEERRFELKASAGVLEFFGNWLYSREAGSDISWARWIDIYVFACEHVVDELASETIHQMLAKLDHEPWIPNVDEIEHIYEHTSEDSPLRELAMICLAFNMTSERAEILYNAHEMFVRDFAVHVSLHKTDQLDEFKMQHIKPSEKQYFSGHIWFRSTISFHLKNSSRRMVLHTDTFNKEESAEPFYRSMYEAPGTCELEDFGLRTFAAWLYFDDSLRSLNHECQESPDLFKLLDCYAVSIFLLQCELEEVDSSAEVNEHEGDDMRERLHVHAYQFKDSVIEAIVVHCQRREGVPSLEEVKRAYSITTAEDPLRELIADVYILGGRPAVLDAAHVEFQRYLNTRLIKRVEDTQNYIDRVNHIVEQHKLHLENEDDYDARRRKKAYKYRDSGPNADSRMEELAEINVPIPLEINASMYL